MPSVRSIALGFWIRAGSRDEGDEQAGISHFLEHLLFKGTDRFSSLEIDEAFDAMGAEVNAGTGKETTSVYSRFLDGHLERAFDVLQDMVLRPAYPDIDSERQVVIEEIAMYEDEPQDKVHDVLAGAIFGEHPLGPPDHRPRRRGVLGAGARTSRRGTTRATCPAASSWPRPATWTTSGSWRWWRAPSTARRPPRRRPRAARPNGAAPRLRFHRKDTEQYHLCLGGPGHPARRRPALRAADAGHDPRRLHLVAALPGGAREARAGLLGLLLLEPVRGLRPGRRVRGHAPRQRGRGARR